MRREQSTTSLSSPSSSSSPERFCSYKKLNLVAFAGTLVYIGYLFGSIENGGPVANVINSAFTSSGAESSSSEDRPVRLRASSPSIDVAASSSWDNKRAREEEESTSDDVMAEKESPATYAKGPVIYNDKAPVSSINLIGERHSGTNWITDHLVDCFGEQIPVQTDFTRFKHWFQFDDANVRNDSALVIAMFRDPYDWVEAMRERPHHAHDHIGMEWHEFVTKPWVGPRGPADHAEMDQAAKEGIHIDKSGCLAGYGFDEVIPCAPEDSIVVDGYSNYMYELKHDKSHRAYGSIIELRTAKILNFLQVPKSHGVKAFFPERYEALNLRGTADFLKQLEEVTGLKAQCEPVPGTGVVKHKNVDPEYTEWMNKYHDWNAEGMIGYVKRDPVPFKTPPPSSEEELPDLVLVPHEHPLKVTMRQQVSDAQAVLQLKKERQAQAQLEQANEAQVQSQN